MEMVTSGTRVVFGIPSQIPLIKNLPDGRVRFRFRNTRTARIYIKSENVVRCFVLEDCGDHWNCNPRLIQGANIRQPI